MAERRVSLYRTIAMIGYTTFRNAMHGAPTPHQAAFFKRMTHPVPGDLVLETSSFWTWSRNPEGLPGQSLGWLQREEWEPVIDQKGLDRMHAEGDYYDDPRETLDDVPKERVWYINPIDSAVTECRWTNATFIALPSEAWHAWEATR